MDPRRTVFLSRSSISLDLIFLTTSTSAVSATYRRFAGDAEGTLWLDLKGVAEAVELRPLSCGGVPGGVVDPAVKSRGSHSN